MPRPVLVAGSLLLLALLAAPLLALPPPPHCVTKMFGEFALHTQHKMALMKPEEDKVVIILQQGYILGVTLKGVKVKSCGGPVKMSVVLHTAGNKTLTVERIPDIIDSHGLNFIHLVTYTAYVIPEELNRTIYVDPAPFDDEINS